MKKGSEHCSAIYELIHKWCFKPMLFFRLPAKVITFPLTSAVFCVYWQLASVVNYDGEHGKHQTVSANHQHVNIAIVSFSAWWYWQLAWSGRAASQSCLHGCKLKLDYFVVVDSRFCESSVFPAIVSQRMDLCQLFSAVVAHVGGGSRRDSTRFFASVKPKSCLCYSKGNIYNIFFLPSGPPQVEKLISVTHSSVHHCWILMECAESVRKTELTEKGFKKKNCWLLKKLATVTTNTPVR